MLKTASEISAIIEKPFFFSFLPKLEFDFDLRLNFMLSRVAAARIFNPEQHTVPKSQKGLIQYCERSELRLHFE